MLDAGLLGILQTIGDLIGPLDLTTDVGRRADTAIIARSTPQHFLSKRQYPDLTRGIEKEEFFGQFQLIDERQHIDGMRRFMARQENGRRAQ